MKTIIKGTIIWPKYESWWYIVVEQVGNDLHCICDNANNIYSFTIDDIVHYYTPYQAMKRANWGNAYLETEEENDILNELVDKRDIPVDVIAEVLAGCHNDRFDHWKKK